MEEEEEEERGGGGGRVTEPLLHHALLRILPAQLRRDLITLIFYPGVLPRYFSSEWSFAQFHLQEDTPFIAAFGSQNTVVIVGLDGSFYRCYFDPARGGEMSQKEYVRFLKPQSWRR